MKLTQNSYRLNLVESRNHRSFLTCRIAGRKQSPLHWGLRIFQGSYGRTRKGTLAARVNVYIHGLNPHCGTLRQPAQVSGSSNAAK